ncbi:signal peptidase [Megasphaera cerevisiae DSM 20462]|uniref:Signal peptidase I n=1 Tax=Megasphaera cerevisiae DSM 20462 TaxID=1122219 RepID=A0A0J6WVG7_9FIRM|nr:signal peptidase I [Megasphaera cerevisiae]KMO86208.1 signal peptidase [Megasphaera cerevisiae DSM 20462]MCI1750356.1 signal peptidase I [Megasphaera cerevisiae]OKY53860.1 signal peptidase I [Megasphaera cerevisiae]SKA03272.1 signal peptidase I [Megasphaera cerevisiae DSM 20462]
MSTFLHEIYEWLYSIIIALAIALVIHIFFFQPTRVSGESMVPTLHNGEYLIVSKWNHVMGEVPNYGDIVIIDSRVQYPRTWKDDVTEPMNNYLAFFDHDLQTKNIWVKRVIGRPGDTLAFHDGKVWRNGEALDETYINEPMTYSRKDEIKIPEGYVFCMGDNRNHSSDSRFIGPVPIDHVLGKVIW